MRISHRRKSQSHGAKRGPTIADAGGRGCASRLRSSRSRPGSGQIDSYLPTWMTLTDEPTPVRVRSCLTAQVRYRQAWCDQDSADRCESTSGGRIPSSVEPGGPWSSRPRDTSKMLVDGLTIKGGRWTQHDLTPQSKVRLFPHPNEKPHRSDAPLPLLRPPTSGEPALPLRRTDPLCGSSSPCPVRRSLRRFHSGSCGNSGRHKRPGRDLRLLRTRCQGSSSGREGKPCSCPSSDDDDALYCIPSDDT